MPSILIYIIAAYVFILIIIYFFQERLIFKPEKLKQDFIYKYDIPFKELFIEVEKGVTINGLHFYTKNPNGLILYLHGNTRSIKGWAKYARDFYRYNYDVVLVDYRGFGKSTGTRGEKVMLNDMQVVYDSLAVQYHENQLIVYGRSLGSGFAARLASDNSPRYLILDAPYFNFRMAVQRFIPILPMKYILRFQFETNQMDKKSKLSYLYFAWH